ncbi:aldo/keto reductase [Sphingomonas nostoxanthinifaciens]|uniref:aldo/keto reductase n=1 Tax=Sphingomonas nostoxanthinifaciens TaxID=2872652 RepID=UPI001CC21A2D|nr:aldo/keto reductase [Sphingomonas nostoxanthinifaciens]UAK23918.1 aldo/keto reductase [Sphingomonas nostoxanthinifaciens]
MTAVPDILLNDGARMPQIGFGVFQMPIDETERQVASAIGQGYRAVDTAKFYGNEEGVGAAVRESDDWIFVTTKLWNGDHGYDTALRAFDASMTRLGIDKLDLYLIHWPLPSLDKYVETWRALVRLQEEGRVGSIGVSNFTVEHLERIIDDSGVVPVTNQIELHPHFQQSRLRDFHAERGIATTSWSPLGRSAALGDEAIAALARKHGRTPAQIILRWHVQLGLIAIPKSSSPERQAENIALFDFALDADDMAAIGRLDNSDGRIGPDPEQLGPPQ